MRQNFLLIEVLPCRRTSSPAVLVWLDVMLRQESASVEPHEADYQRSAPAEPVRESNQRIGRPHASVTAATPNFGHD